MGEASETGENTLKRSLGPGSLIALGIGAIIGTGIFVLTGPAAAHYAGPGVVYSFILAAIGCVFAGLCYAEFAAMIPVAGSAYTYGYATLGEIFAWIIGWGPGARICVRRGNRVLRLERLRAEPRPGTSACGCRLSWRARRGQRLYCTTGTGNFWGASVPSWRSCISIRRRCRSGTASST